ncbi:MAG: amino acid ABC transporter permease [Jiangellaceae bacterium]|nr:amino acid ABC transporter permease [Jiangellaceae bacterium]
MDAVFQNLDLIRQGFTTTITLTLLSAMGALVLGTLIAAMRVSPVPPLRWTGGFYVQVVRNTPLTVVFFFFVFGLPEVGIVVGFYPFAVMALTVYTASFVAEAVRSGINSVPVGQAEASRSVGMTFTQTLGVIVLPQALRSVIPPLASVFIALLKNTSIAFAFGVFEGTSASNVLINRFGSQVLQILLITALVYLALALLMSAAFGWLERAVAITR